MNTYRAVLEAWQHAVARSAGDPHFTFSCPQAFWEVGRRALAAGDYASLASLYETVGVSDLLLMRAHGDMLPLAILDSLGSLVKAVHWSGGVPLSR